MEGYVDDVTQAARLNWHLWTHTCYQCAASMGTWLGTHLGGATLTVQDRVVYAAYIAYRQCHIGTCVSCSASVSENPKVRSCVNVGGGSGS